MPIVPQKQSLVLVLLFCSMFLLAFSDSPFPRTAAAQGAGPDFPEGWEASGAEADEKHSREEHEDHGDEPGQQEEGEHRDHEPGIVQLSAEALKEAGIQVVAVRKQALRQSIRTTGELKLHPDRMARVGPRIEGRVEELLVKEGDRIRKGQVLARLLSVQLGEAKAEFLARKAKLELAQSNFEREKSLRAKGIIPEKDLLEADADRIEATVELDSAENHLHILGLTETEIQGLKSQEHDLSAFEVRAPLSGIVLERPISLGQMAEETATLFVLADLSELWAQVNVFERDLSSVEIGSNVTLHLDAYPDAPVTGQISYISAQLDERSRSARARVVVANPEERLRPGMFLTAQIEGVGSTHSPAFVLPQEAVQREGQRFFVFISTGAPGRYQRVFVELGDGNGQLVTVRSGLEEGVKVVTRGSFLLKSELAKESMGGGHSH